ncbi:Thymidylate synthase, partial [Trichinella spiralis]
LSYSICILEFIDIYTMTETVHKLDTNSTSQDDYVNQEELNYLNQLKDIIDHGVRKNDRTGIGTLSTFGTQSRYCLRDDIFPLLTTKRVFWRGVVEELLWFISGSTNAKQLSEKNVNIWDGNSSREFLDSRGLYNYEEGDLGPVYGFQWRHFGCPYSSMTADYKGKGYDQLQQCIKMIREEPESRRIIMTAWNPCDLEKVALPPCHCFVQFYVADGELSCQMYQRSADMGLGVPFNIASYSLLTRMIAHITSLKPGFFIHTIGDAHVYLTHVDALKVQMERKPRPFPKLKILRNVENIDDFRAEDFELINYKPYPKISMPMARLELEILKLQNIQNDIKKQARIRQQVETQYTENHFALEELNLLTDQTLIYKMIGPVLVKHSLAEAKGTIIKRLEFIEQEKKRLDDALEKAKNEVVAQKDKINFLQNQLSSTTAE